MQSVKEIFLNFINFITSKLITNDLLIKIHDNLKKFINLIKIPDLVAFVFGGTPKTETQDTWDRLGMENKAIGETPEWLLFTLCGIVVLMSVWSDIALNLLESFKQTALATFSFNSTNTVPFTYAIDALKYVVMFLAKFGGLAPLSLILYYLIKSFKKQ